MDEKKYKARIVLGGETIYETEVLAFSKEQAMEFAYEAFEQESYASVESHDESTDDEWECQHCHKNFPATDEFGRVESDLGFLCHKCIKELSAKGAKLTWVDEEEL